MLRLFEHLTHDRRQRRRDGDVDGLARSLDLGLNVLQVHLEDASALRAVSTSSAASTSAPRA